MDSQEIRTMLYRTDALRAGHYLRASGRHTDYYVECAHLFQCPRDAEKICGAIAAHYADQGVQLVLSAAVGGVIAGYEVARQLGCRMIYAERRDKVLTLRRGFTMSPGTKVLIVEDTVSTGQSVRELMEIVRALGAETVGVACVVDTAGGRSDFGCGYFPLHTVKMLNCAPDACPLCKENKPLDNV